MFENMKYENLGAAVNPKMMGAMNLHQALVDMPLDFFVMTSFISVVPGNLGQTNYSAGNNFPDALAWHRNQHDLVASSIALPWFLTLASLPRMRILRHHSLAKECTESMKQKCFTVSRRP